MVILIKFLIIILSSISLITGIVPSSSKPNTNINDQFIDDECSTIIDDIIGEASSSINEVNTQSSDNKQVDAPISEDDKLIKMDLLILSGHANMEIDPGAVSQGRYEYAYAKEFTDLLANHIKSKYPHINIILEDAPYKASGEVTYINKVRPDYVISIHFNAGGGTGFEIITPLANKNLTVANSIVSNLKEANIPIRPLAIYSRSTSTNRIERTVGTSLSGTDYYGVINMGSKLDIISEILEMEFIDNASAMQKYEANKNVYIEAIARAINEYYYQEFKN